LKDENIKLFSSLDQEVDQYQLSTSTTLKLFMASQREQIDTLHRMVEKAIIYGRTIYEQKEEAPKTAKQYKEKLTWMSEELKSLDKKHEEYDS